MPAALQSQAYGVSPMLAASGDGDSHVSGIAHQRLDRGDKMCVARVTGIAAEKMRSRQ
jgi:hypothetical protein